MGRRAANKYVSECSVCVCASLVNHLAHHLSIHPSIDRERWCKLGVRFECGPETEHSRVMVVHRTTSSHSTRFQMDFAKLHRETHATHTPRRWCDGNARCVVGCCCCFWAALVFGFVRIVGSRRWKDLWAYSECVCVRECGRAFLWFGFGWKGFFSCFALFDICIYLMPWRDLTTFLAPFALFFQCELVVKCLALRVTATTTRWEDTQGCVYGWSCPG